MQYYLIMCRSLTYAQRAQRTLEREGLHGALVKAPQELSTGGCTYGVRLAAGKIEAGLRILRKTDLPLGKIYQYQPEGGFQEVFL